MSLNQQQTVEILDQKRFVETLRERSDLVSLVSDYLVLKKSGQNYTGLCPFHTEKSASFVVSPSRQLFHCFGCGAGGDVFQFLMKIAGVSFPEALSQLARKAGVPLPSREGRPSGRSSNLKASDSAESTTEQIYALNRDVADYFHQNLLKRPEAAAAMAYLTARSITQETVKTFMIGYALPARDDLVRHFGRRFTPGLLSTAGLIAPDAHAPAAASGSGGRFYDRFRNRILFPIRTLQGDVSGFGGRLLDQSHPKYLNTPETPVFVKGKQLFGLDQFHRTRRDARPEDELSSLVIVEGYFDVVSAHQAGIHNVVGTLGTALTAEHLNLVRRVSEKVVLLFDPDDAGLRATRRGATLCLEKEIPVRIATLPKGEDPDLYIRKNGRVHFLQKIREAIPAIEFFIQHAAPKTPDSSIPSPSPAALSIEDKARNMAEILPLIGQLKTKIEQSHYLKMFADTLAVSEGDVRMEFARISGKQGKPGAASTPASIPMLAQDEALLLTLLLQDKRPPSDLNDRLVLDDFKNPQVKSILQHLWNEAEGRWSGLAGRSGLAGLSDVVDAEALPLLTRLSVAPVLCENPLEGDDCITSLRRKRLQREGTVLQNALRLAEREKDASRMMSLQQQFLNLKRELSLLAVSESV